MCIVIKRLIETVENVRPLAENRIDFDQLRMSWYEFADADSVDFNCAQRRLLLEKRKHASFDAI